MAKEELLVVYDINNDDDNDLLADRYREVVEDSTDIYINNWGGGLASGAKNPKFLIVFFLHSPECGYNNYINIMMIIIIIIITIIIVIVIIVITDYLTKGPK